MLEIRSSLVVEDETGRGSDQGEKSEEIDEEEGVLLAGTELQCAEDENGEGENGNIGSEMEDEENDGLNW